MTPEQKTAIFRIVVYHLADVLYEQVARQGLKLLKKERVIPVELKNLVLDDVRLLEWAGEQYTEILEEHALEHWGEDWVWSYDYWGAKGLWFREHLENLGGHAPKGDGLYTGDSCGNMMLFSCWQALQDYTQEALETQMVC